MKKNHEQRGVAAERHAGDGGGLARRRRDGQRREDDEVHEEDRRLERECRRLRERVAADDGSDGGDVGHRVRDAEPGRETRPPIEQLALEERPPEDRHEHRHVDAIQRDREARRVDQRGDAEQHEHDQPRAIQHSLGPIALAIEHDASGVDGRGECAWS